MSDAKGIACVACERAVPPSETAFWSEDGFFCTVCNGERAAKAAPDAAKAAVELKRLLGYRHLTSRECLYIGTPCHYKGDDGAECPSPSTHRVQNGPYGGWWFVCFDHIEKVATGRKGPDGKHKKARVRHLARSPGQAAGARLLLEMITHVRRKHFNQIRKRKRA